MQNIRLGILLSAFVFMSMSAANAETDGVYQRIMKKQSIDCGYAEWPPFLIIDPNTKHISGLMYDLWEMLGKKLDLKINWTTQIGWGEVTEAVKDNKFDVFCVSVWPDASRMKNLLLSRSIFYTPLYLYARADDKRFDNNYELLDDPSHTVIGQDGELTGSELARKFPKAKLLNVSANAPQPDVYVNVASNKGDVTLMDSANAKVFMDHNPGKLRQVLGKPLVLVPNSLPVAIGEYQLKTMLDAALNDLINDHDIEALIKKYKLDKDAFSPEADVQITR